jgi:hypothetical protein
MYAFILEHLVAVYLVVIAFYVALEQWPSLLGSQGLTPALLWQKRVRAGQMTWYDTILAVPSIFAVVPPTDKLVASVLYAGSALSIYALWRPSAIAFLLIWILYQSVANAGGVWYGFGT